MSDKTEEVGADRDAGKAPREQRCLQSFFIILYHSFSILGFLPRNLALTNLGKMIYICNIDSITKHFSARDDIVIFDRIDDSELLVPDAIAYLSNNIAAAELVAALKEELDHN